MNIEIHFGWWLVPLLFTGFLWLWILLKGLLAPSGSSSWFPDLVPVFFGLLGICGTMAIWLVYFMAAFFFGIK